MKKFLCIILAFILAAGLCSCMPASYTVPDDRRTTEPATRETTPPDQTTESIPVEIVTDAPTDPGTDVPETPAVPTDSQAPSGSAETSAPYTDPDHGVLKDLGIWPDAASLPNNSIPYGNDWEDRDQYGIASTRSTARYTGSIPQRRSFISRWMRATKPAIRR